jgi:hypothetical protein
MSKTYDLGSPEKQAWLQEYTFAPRGIGFLEPGVVSPDAAEFSAYNVAKSFYQTRPDVFNISYIASTTGLDPEDIKARLQKMYDKRLIMLVYNPPVSLMGFGLYYWVVKLKEGTTKEQKQVLTDWIQNKDDICTGYCMESGDFDYFCGNHMRTLDNLLNSIIEPIKNYEFVESVQICPIRRDIRESHVNMWDAPHDGFREFHLNSDEREKIISMQDVMEKEDFQILDAINNSKSVKDMLDFNVLQELSGLDGKTMEQDYSFIVDDKHVSCPMLYFNYRALGLKQHFILVRLFQNTPSFVKAQLADQISENDSVNNLFELCDAYYDYCLSSFEDISDIDTIVKFLEDCPYVEQIWQATSDRQFRRWTARLDNENDMWEECVFTDDFLENRKCNEVITEKKCCGGCNYES